MFTPNPDLFEGFTLRDWLEEFDSMMPWNNAMACIREGGKKIKLGVLLETMKVEALPEGSKALGECHPNGQIKISRFAVSTREGFVDTLRHEVAHMIDCVIDEQMSHGRTWRKWARRMRCRASARTKVHDPIFWEASGMNKGTKLIAQCVGCGYELMRKRRSDISRSTHRDCGGRFVNVFKDADEMAKFLHYDYRGIIAGGLDSLRE